MAVRLEPRKFFDSFPETRWAAQIDDMGNVLFSAMRPGRESLIPENEITVFMEADRGKAILKASEGLSDWLGGVECALVRYKKVFLFVIQLEGSILVLSVDRVTSLAQIAEIAQSVLVELHLA
jgi:transcriptional antiterminator Rof (Rho-off)